jgi:F-type H+-transporting ATPase subunit delta
MEDIQELVRHQTVMDDTERRVARVYAEALYDAAAAKHQEGEILEELNALEVALFRGDPRMQAFVTSTALGRERRKAFLKAFEGRAHELLVNFLYVLNEHDRLDQLRGVIIAYQDLYDHRTGRMRVVVRSAVPLDEAQAERLRQELREAFRREPVLHTTVDPDLLGGLVVQVEDWLYDASVRARLQQLRNQITERSSHEIQSGRDRFSSADGD